MEPKVESIENKWKIFFIVPQKPYKFDELIGTVKNTFSIETKLIEHEVEYGIYDYTISVAMLFDGDMNIGQAIYIQRYKWTEIPVKFPKREFFYNNMKMVFDKFYTAFNKRIDETYLQGYRIKEDEGFLNEAVDQIILNFQSDNN